MLNKETFEDIVTNKYADILEIIQSDNFYIKVFNKDGLIYSGKEYNSELLSNYRVRDIKIENDYLRVYVDE